MRLPAIALALACLILMPLQAIAQTFDTPEALLTDLYAYAQSEDTQLDVDLLSLYSNYFSEGLKDLYRDDRKKTPDGEMGALDFDPVVAGQEIDIQGLEIGTPIIIDNKAELEVSFTQFGEPVTLYYTLVRENGGWKVDDIANQQGEYPWSLRNIFATAL